MLKFLNEKITVTLSEDGNEPTSFLHSGKEHTIREVVKAWQDGAFQAPVGRRGSAKQWWNQRGRQFYRVITDEDITFEMYHDPRKNQWFLSKEWRQSEQE
ncbi:MAG TPA: hypothetical protein GX721_09885 [Firmicutes bacterium]|nr:hypothetical protein [Bacillota bacterium]